MSPTLRVIFAGTPEFAAVSLQALVKSGHDVCAVYTQPDRPAGRGRKLKASPVKELANLHQVPVYQPATLKTAQVQTQIQAHAADVMVVAAYGLILPPAILEIPRLGCLNIHASLLPRWRGAAPIQRAILAGDCETGITIMQMDAGLDTGAMLLRKSCVIESRATAGGLHDRLAELGAEAILEALARIGDGDLQPQVQDSSLATYAAKIDKSEAELDWRQNAVELDRRIRAFNPWPVAYTQYKNDSLRIWEAEPVSGENSPFPPGTVLAENKAGIDIACGMGTLRLIRLQLPGGRAQTAPEFLNAHRLLGQCLGRP